MSSAVRFDKEVCFTFNCSKLNAEIIISSYFPIVWGFTAVNFQPAVTGCFLTAFVVELYINSCPSTIGNILRSNTNMGVHTRVIAYGSSGIIWEYIWSHISAAPFGVHRPLAYRACHILQPWAQDALYQVSSPSQIEFECKHCQTHKNLSLHVTITSAAISYVQWAP